MSAVSRRADLEGLLGHPLSDAQWAAVSAPVEPAVIVAGAGSGKTSVMSARMAWLVIEGLADPGAILGLTFTTKAAAELLRRTRRLLDGRDPDGEMPTVLTYHAFAARIIADYGIRVGLEPGAAVLTDGARESLALDVVRTTSLPLADLDRAPATLASSLLAFDNQLAELGLHPQAVLDDALDLIAWLGADEGSLQVIGREMLATARVRAALVGLVEEFRVAKAERQALDFADQIRWANLLVASSPDVREELRERYRFVLLDEYQDTSVAQRMLMQAAFGDQHPVTAVGDPCQSIYEWRGASVDNIDRFPEHFPAARGPAPRYTLEENRRSAPRILDLANAMSQRLRDAHPGVAALVPAASDKGDGVVTCALLPTFGEEVAWVGERIERIGRDQGGWSGIAVLARTGETLRAVDRELRSRGIPTHAVGIAGLLDVPVVAELRAMLEVIDDPTANDACVRLLTGPRWRIGPRDLAALGRLARELVRAAPEAESIQEANSVQRLLRAAVLGSDPSDLVSLSEAAGHAGEAEDLSPEARERLTRFADELRRLRRHRGEPPAEFIGRVLAVSGLGIEARLGTPSDTADNVRALAQFRDLVARIGEEGPTPSLGLLLARLRQAEELGDAPDQEETPAVDAVVLMTAHRAKGLEFPHVVIPGLVEGVFPSRRGRSRWPKNASAVPWHLRDDAPSGLPRFPGDGLPRAKEHREFEDASAALEELEELRLAYVAVTRAERTLTVSGHWWGPTQSRPRGPGDYLLRVRDWCVGSEGGGDVAAWAEEPEDGSVNPALESPEVAWPAPLDISALQRRRDVADAVRRADPERAVMASRRSRDWESRARSLLDEARRAREPRTVAVPAHLSASDLIRLHADPEGFALDLARPMPRRSNAAARRGTALHAWIEGQFAAQTLFDLMDLDSADELGDDAGLERLRQAFLRTPYSSRTPLAVEAPFSLVLAGRVIRGRIDAVFAGPDGRHEVVDWKTGGRGGLQALQLGIYRLAWSQIAGLPPEQVDARFVLVATGEVVDPETVPGREEIESILSGP